MNGNTENKNKNVKPASKITYKDLFAMLQRGGCSSITLAIHDLQSFKRYATKNKMIDELNFHESNNCFIVTKIKTK